MYAFNANVKLKSGYTQAASSALKISIIKLDPLVYLMQCNTKRRELFQSNTKVLIEQNNLYSCLCIGRMYKKQQLALRDVFM